MKNLTLIYWKSEKFYLGKLLEQPEIMTQGETFEELIKNIKDAYYLMMFDDVPKTIKSKKLPYETPEFIRQLEKAGCILVRHGARHDIYLNPQNGEKQPVPRHLEIDDHLVRHIKKYLHVEF